jgi:hypothetical protein
VVFDERSPHSVLTRPESGSICGSLPRRNGPCWRCWIRDNRHVSRPSRVLFLSPPPGETRGVVCPAARRAVDVRITRSYLLLPVRRDSAVTVVNSTGSTVTAGWQHVTVPGDVQLHLTGDTPKRRLPIGQAYEPNADWRTVAVVVAEPSRLETSVMAPPDQQVKYGPGVLIVAPNLPAGTERWRMAVEVLAGPSATVAYPSPPIPSLSPVPMNSGHVLFRAPIHSLLPKARHPAPVDVALRAWWAPETLYPAGTTVFE